MRIARYEPWSLVHKMHNDLDRIFAARGATGGSPEEPVADWLPAVDIAEEESRFVVRADIPGVSPDMIEITMDDGILSIRGERRSEIEDGDERYRRVERASGRFFRRFNLPDAADAEGITARHSHGVLEIVIPKQAKVMPRKIAVEAA